MNRLDPALTTRLDFTRLPRELAVAAAGLPTATLHEAAKKTGALPAAIKPVAPHFRFAGSALTVHSPGGDNLWLHRALDVAQPGDVLVVHVGGAYEHGYWGEVMATMAKARGLAGLVIDGGVRDSVLLAGLGFPVFSRGLSIRGTGKDFGATGWINYPVMMGNVIVHAGDLVAGDADGVVAIPAASAAAVVDLATRREADEAAIVRRLEQGESTLDVYGWR
ncbi:4-carboxy-4-hydroxy-2-oxoadipate aldolase/oxaloacetate decarboxylase [Thauera sinica]|uniref:Putative 4-hydroxy-4-methyl-2-oxoglutarate aldolase n=1 Tax=Thauera sinica TaxID=2665146 RepID=A0ABW1AXN3_9RHOO|nr:4-carboxy-4-hydroxy-2-oxoadipate aldolase/oxaloacetate decarboxylase [Thauera sp. K11]ATE61172.1 4-hydroxy-4-methyl-2-oxoglutarate aldolase [Thauera sp. K11]